MRDWREKGISGKEEREVGLMKFQRNHGVGDEERYLSHTLRAMAGAGDHSF